VIKEYINERCRTCGLCDPGMGLCWMARLRSDCADDAAHGGIESCFDDRRLSSLASISFPIRLKLSTTMRKLRYGPLHVTASRYFAESWVANCQVPKMSVSEMLSVERSR